ncbi:MAG: hypothetical protein ACI4QV_03935 [Acutalibacteraceae bacterium]
MEKQIFDMQQDAIRRVHEMQKKARQTISHDEPKYDIGDSPSQPKKGNGLQNLINLKDFTGSSEELLILTLAILISKESNDELLSLALLYLLL